MPVGGKWVNEPQLGSTKLVWDGALRIFHWSLAACVTGAWATQEMGPAYMEWHMVFGCTALALVLWRIAWGILGPRTARFHDFVSGPRRIFAYLHDRRSAGKQHFDGHNPIGGVSVVVMLVLVLVQAVTGLGNSDDILFAGPWHHTLSAPLANRLSYIHSLNFYILATIIVVHISAVAMHWLLGGDNLILPMLSGRKPRERAGAGDDIGGRYWPKALLLAVASAAVVTAVIALAPEPPPLDPDMF